MTQEIITKQEERLRQAQLKSDVATLNELIADELQFVFLDGSLASKAMDLETHRSGAIRILSIDFSEQDIRRLSDAVATVTAKARMSVLFHGQEVQGDYRYCRTWLKRGDRWQIIAGSVTTIAS